MENDGNQLIYFLRTVKKYLSNLCDSCIDEICDSALSLILQSDLEPNQRVETYFKFIKAKRNKIDSDYREVYENLNDSKDNIMKNTLNNHPKSDSENNSNASDCDGNCINSASLKDINSKSIKVENNYPIFKKNKGNKKRKKKNAV